ncbi:sensor domain-containing protein [Natrialba sp. PRR66]|uniref:sensor domain-containing protein n=1 Tax=Natrialba sp. PRR66 TaxID=3098146 RepID=UPI002B1E1DBD|nr:sensor domain-containing protein [Natrialba sp. PRR66]
MFPLGLVYCNLVIVGFVTGISLAIVGIGVLIVVLTLAVSTGLVEFERTLVRRLLGIEITPPATERGDSLSEWAIQLVTDLRTWKGVAYLMSVFGFGSLVFGLLASLLATAWTFLTAPLYYENAPVVAYSPIPRGEFTLDVLFGWDSLLIGLTTTFRLGSWQIETFPGALFVAVLGLGLLLVVLQISNVLASLWGRYARVMLSVPRYWKPPSR